MKSSRWKRKCACGCRQLATMGNGVTAWASIDCAIKIANKRRTKAAADKAKKERATFKVRKEKAKRLGDLKADAQAAVNRYVRLRDREKPCISCDRPATWQGQWHASHFKSLGANSALRFNVWNIHKACSVCNNHLSGNIGEYRIRLPGRIGLGRFEFIENHPRKRIFTRDYLLRIKSIFAKRCRVLRERIGNALQD